MEEMYEVYPDKVRTYMTTTVFTFFTVCFFIVVFLKTWLVIKIFAVFFGVLFGYLAYQTFRNGHLNHPDYVINQDGVIDNTKTPAVKVTWDNILKIEMTPNNAVMQIGILAKSTVNDQAELSTVMKNNMSTNGNIAFYSVMIDGFKYRQKPFLAIFKDFKCQIKLEILIAHQ